MHQLHEPVPTEFQTFRVQDLWQLWNAILVLIPQHSWTMSHTGSVSSDVSSHLSQLRVKSISHFACLGGCHSDRGALKPPSARQQGLRLPGVPRRWQARQKRQCNQAYPTVEDSLSQRYSTANILSTLPNRKDSAFHLDRASSHEGKASKWKLVCQNSLPLLLHRFLHLYLPPW